nr:MAG TPA: hypothetical protein [Caudoviricetes sp.]
MFCFHFITSNTLYLFMRSFSILIYKSFLFFGWKRTSDILYIH